MKSHRSQCPDQVPNLTSLEHTSDALELARTETRVATVHGPERRCSIQNICTCTWNVSQHRYPSAFYTPIAHSFLSSAISF
jgi:hypothetical protein